MPPARAVLRVLLAAAVLSVAGGEAGTCDPDNEAWNAETLQCEPLQLSCSNCEKGFYFDTTTASCVQCAELETTINVGASDESECVCAEGAGGTPCAQCTWDKYSDEEADTACKECPANSGTTTQGAETNTECLCIPGYEESAGGVCVACNSGYAKISATSATYGSLYTVSAASCTACPANEYSDFAAASSCHKCPYYSSNSGTGLNAQSCVCHSNFETNEQSLSLKSYELDTITDADFHDDLDGRCGYAVDNTNSGQSIYFKHGATVNESFANVFCRSIGGHSGYIAPRHGDRNIRTSWESKTMITGISCSGTESDISECYSTSTGGSPDSYPVRVCCAVNPDTSTVTEYTHKTCDKCNSGYVANEDGVCTACGPGTYSLSETRTDVPNMPPGETSVDVYTRCASCPQYSNSLTASGDIIDCRCNAGYRYLPQYEVCYKCPQGQYRDRSGVCEMCDSGVCTACTTAEEEQYYACDLCPANTVGEYIEVPDSQFAACQSCMEGGTTQGRTGMSGTNDEKCHCDRGWAVDTSSVSYSKFEFHNCIQCVPGTYKHWVSNPWYIQYFELTGAYVCISEYSSESTETKCTLDGTIPELSYLYASQDCLLCAAGKYSANAGATTADACTDCEAGKFSANDGSTECSQCPQGTYFGGTGAAQCTECPDNSYTATATDSSIQQEFTDIAHCRCQPGYWFDSTSSGSECQLCPAGSYCIGNDKTPCSGNTYSLEGASECVECPEFTSIINDEHTTAQSCQCNAGYSGNDGGPCTACAGGTYKITVGSAPCSECITDFYTPNLDANIMCVSCPINSRAPASSDHIDDCTCNAGYTKQNEGTPVCLECGADKYCIGNNFARDCPPHSTSPIGSDSEHDCTCNGGYYEVNRTHEEVNNLNFGDAEHDEYVHYDSDATHTEPHKFCASCPANNYYCTGDQRIPCPTNTRTLQENGHASSARDCLCEASYWRNGCTRDWQDPQPYVRHVYETGVCTRANLLDPADHISKVDDELNTDDAYIGSFWREQSVTVDAVQKCQRLELCNITGSFFEQACTQCPGDIYCSVGTTHTVSAHCPEHSTAQPGSDDIDDCKCLAGYKRITR